MLAFFIMNILLLVSLTAASITIYDIKMSAEIADSVPAFYAADAGSELCLYQVRISGIVCSAAMTLSNGATVSASSDANKVLSGGIYKNVSRKIEVTW